MTQDNEKGQRIFRKLNYFYVNEIPIHFKLEVNDDFRNGKIIDLSEDKLTLVLIERVLGELPFLLEEIKEGSISKFEEKGE